MMSRKAQKKQKVSVFARVLQQLLDETGFYKRADWSQFLGVSGPALSQWVNDRTVPRADLLRMIIDLLQTRGGAEAASALDALEAIMDAPAEAVSPIGSRLGSSLRAYLGASSLSEIGRSLRGLSPEEQIAVLRDGSVERTAPTAPVSLSTDGPVVVELDGGLGPAWRMPRLLRASGIHGRKRPAGVDEFAASGRMILVGSPGSGKTAFLSHLTRHHRKRRRNVALSASPK